jgi:hypothetical protein
MWMGRFVPFEHHTDDRDRFGSSGLSVAKRLTEKHRSRILPDLTKALTSLSRNRGACEPFLQEIAVEWVAGGWALTEATSVDAFVRPIPHDADAVSGLADSAIQDMASEEWE